MKKFKQPKDFKTTFISLVLLLVIVVSIVGVFTQKITIADAGTFIALIGTTLTAIGFKLTADSTKNYENEQ